METRWFTAPPKELQRLATVAGEAVRARGGGTAGPGCCCGPPPHPAAPGGSPAAPGGPGGFGTLLVRRGSFTADEVERARAFAAGGGLTLFYAGDDLEALLAPAGTADAVAARPATDDRPYFFDFLPLVAGYSAAICPPAACPRPRRPAARPDPGAVPRGGRRRRPPAAPPRIVPRQRRLGWARSPARRRPGIHAGRDGPVAAADPAARSARPLPRPLPGGAAARGGPGAAGWRRAAGRPALALAGEAALLALAALLPALASTTPSAGPCRPGSRSPSAPRLPSRRC